ncbi:MAG: rhomboid family intramembrane serine protease [Gemmatimonadetes bacterium]|nr:rhomboid family intramembrane serine protease [Gemmatimonadota bacterium]
MQQFESVQYQRPLSPFSLTPWVRAIIIANAVVYLLMITVFTGRWFLEIFAFTPAYVLQRPWTLGSYMFLHGGVMHLAFNMLVLFFFGPAVEDKLGGSSFARYYLLCGLGGAILSLMFQLSPIIGASGAVFGVSLAFAVYWPDAPIMVFPIPVPIKAKWLVGFLAVTSFLFASAGSSDGIAHFAHLGGFLFGAVYLGQRHGWFSRARSSKPATSAPRVLVHPAAQRRSDVAKGQNSGRWSDKSVNDEVDRVLDKISESGIDSLTRAEKKFLDRMSKVTRKH